MSGDMIDYFNKHPQKLKEKQMRDKKKNMGKCAADSFAKISFMAPGGPTPPTPNPPGLNPAGIQPPAMPQIGNSTGSGAPMPTGNAAGLGKMASASFTKKANPLLRGAGAAWKGLSPMGRSAAGSAGIGAAAGGVSAGEGNRLQGMLGGAAVGAGLGAGAHRLSAMRARAPGIPSNTNSAAGVVSSAPPGAVDATRRLPALPPG
jgi:hypothetical protein